MESSTFLLSHIHYLTAEKDLDIPDAEDPAHLEKARGYNGLITFASDDSGLSDHPTVVKRKPLFMPF